jgi:putative tricarboxylic transport membrane protein
VTRSEAPGLDRRAAAAGVAASALAGLSPAAGQLAGVEVIAAGRPGGGDDQLARAVAEGLGTTRLLPSAVAINLPREPETLATFLDGKRPRASLMVVGLSTIGALAIAGKAGLLNGARPLARLLAERQPVVVPESSPLRGLPDLMAAIARDPSSVQWVGRAVGGADHQLCLEMTIAAGGDPARISYRAVDTSATASMEALTGKAAVATGALAEFLQQIRGGTLRALAIASPERAPGVDIATLREQGVGVAVDNWRGLITRDAVGRTLIGRFGEALDRLVDVPGWRQLLNQRHWSDFYLAGEAFERFMAEERARVLALLKRAGLA